MILGDNLYVSIVAAIIAAAAAVIALFSAKAVRKANQIAQSHLDEEQLARTPQIEIDHPIRLEFDHDSPWPYGLFLGLTVRNVGSVPVSIVDTFIEANGDGEFVRVAITDLTNDNNDPDWPEVVPGGFAWARISGQNLIPALVNGHASSPQAFDVTATQELRAKLELGPGRNVYSKEPTVLSLDPVKNGFKPVVYDPETDLFRDP